MQQNPCGPLGSMGVCQPTCRGCTRKAVLTIHLPQQPRMFTEAFSLLFSGAEKSH